MNPYSIVLNLMIIYHQKLPCKKGNLNVSNYIKFRMSFRFKYYTGSLFQK